MSIYIYRNQIGKYWEITEMFFTSELITSVTYADRFDREKSYAGGQVAGDHS